MMRRSLVITPLKSEFLHLTSVLVRRGYEGRPDLIGAVPLMDFPELNIVCAVGGHGKVQFGIQTQFLLNRFPEVQRVFCAGAAGGLSVVKTFDVIVASRTIEHDYTERFDPSPLPFFQGCQDTIEELRAKACKADFPFAVHFDVVASGDEDVVSIERASELHGRTQALAVAWEGAGGARACLFNTKPFIEVRGITDVADNRAPVDFRENLRQAMENVVSVLV
jgi:adenosylhomocysteine nucleosidase